MRGRPKSCCARGDTGPPGTVSGRIARSRASTTECICGGVGLPLLRFRIDADQPDPIWLEPQDGGVGASQPRPRREALSFVTA